MSEVEKALTVSAAVSLAKEKLETITIKVVGEVSELSNKAGYAAVYFTLKDESGQAVLPCMMWMNRFKSAGVQFEIGTVLEVTGRFSLYAPKGRMNFDVSKIALAGEGDLRLQIAALAKKLEVEGLTSPERKKSLPTLPQRIGLVTSPRGAVVYDVLRTLRRRYPLAEVLIAGVPVEGKDAPAQLAQGLDIVQDAGAEVILLVRGGGSFEDFMPFNDEGLARHIASMKVPVITGIGHEPDNSIADMVADIRASTPTAAAEAVAPEISELFAQCSALGRRMGFALSSVLSKAQRKLLTMRGSSIFADSMALVRTKAQQLDDVAMRLEAAIPLSFARRKAALASARVSMVRLAPKLIGNKAVVISRLHATMLSQGKTLVAPSKEKVAIMASALENLSPLAVLSRGYAAVFDGNNKVLSSVSEAEVGSTLNVRLADGKLECNVNQVMQDFIYACEE